MVIKNMNKGKETISKLSFKARKIILLWSKCLCPLKIHMLKPNSECQSIKGEDLDYGDRALINGIGPL